LRGRGALGTISLAATEGTGGTQGRRAQAECWSVGAWGAQRLEDGGLRIEDGEKKHTGCGMKGGSLGGAAATALPGIIEERWSVRASERGRRPEFSHRYLWSSPNLRGKGLGIRQREASARQAQWWIKWLQRRTGRSALPDHWLAVPGRGLSRSLRNGTIEALSTVAIDRNMDKSQLTGRITFQRSGKVNWVRFIPFTALAWIASATLAVLLFVLFQLGIYLVLLVPLIFGLGVGGMVLLAVDRGHCRSRLAAGVLGLVAGTTLYLGYYYVGMVHDLGAHYADRIDLLPKYISFRMKTQVIRDVHAPSNEHEQKPDAFNRGSNWVFFAIEFGLVVAIAMGSGLRRAAKPYCEKCQLWTKREVSQFKPELGPGFVEALRQGAVQSLAALFTSPRKAAAPNTTVALDLCPNLKTGKTADCSVYLSVKQVTENAKGAVLDAFDQAKGKLLARQVIINAEELPALLPAFSVLESVTGTTAAAVLEELQVKTPDAAVGIFADITPVDPAYRGRVLTTKTKLIGNALALLLILGVFGPIALCFLGGAVGFPDHPPVGGVSPETKLLGEFIIGLGIGWFAANGIMLFTAPDYFSTRYLRGVIRREFGRRQQHLVNPGDPEAQFVQVVPRANWGKMKLDDASDVGFMRIDEKDGRILFEGDSEDYRIPVASITSCEVECFVQGQGTHGATAYYRLVLAANHPSGFWEAPFAPRGGSGKFRARKRKKWAEEMDRRIKALMQQAKANRPPAVS
jgi:hypothetical protein